MMGLSKEMETYKALKTVVNFFIVLGIANMTYLIKFKTRDPSRLEGGNFRRIVQGTVCLAIAFVATLLQIYFYGSHIVQGFYKNVELLRHKDQLINSNEVKKVITQFIYFIFSFLQVGFFWHKAMDLKKYLNEINEYEVLYTQTIGQITRPLTNKKASWVMSLITIYCFCFGITYWILHLKVSDSIFTYYRCDDVMRLYTDALWYLLCNAIHNYADQLRTDFMHDFKNDRLGDKFRHYMLLRSRLVDLTLGIRRVAGRMLTIHALQEFVLIVINHYYVVFKLRQELVEENSFDKGILVAAHMVIQDFDVFYFLTWVLMKIYFCVDMAHQTERQMGDLLKLNLLTEISDLQLTGKHEKVTQLKWFLKKVNLTPADVRISKNIVLNRSIFSLMFIWSFYCTFIVLQFYDALTLPHAKELTDNITYLSSQLGKYKTFVNNCFEKCPLAQHTFYNIST